MPKKNKSDDPIANGFTTGLREAARRLNMDHGALAGILRKGRGMYLADGRIDIEGLLKVKKSREGVERKRTWGGMAYKCKDCRILMPGRICGASGFVRAEGDVCPYL